MECVESNRLKIIQKAVIFKEHEYIYIPYKSYFKKYYYFFLLALKIFTGFDDESKPLSCLLELAVVITSADFKYQ